MKKSFHIFGAIAIVLILWQSLVSLGGWNEALLPPPSRVAAGFGELLTDGVLLADIKSSLLRFAAGRRGNFGTGYEEARPFRPQSG